MATNLDQVKQAVLLTALGMQAAMQIEVAKLILLSSVIGASLNNVYQRNESLITGLDKQAGTDLRDKMSHLPDDDVAPSTPSMKK